MEDLNLNISVSNENIKLTPKMEDEIIKNELLNKILQPADIQEILNINFTSSTRGLIRNNVKAILENGTTLKTVSEIRSKLTELSCFGKLSKLEAYGFKIKTAKNKTRTSFIFIKAEKSKKQSVKAKQIKA